MCSRLRTALPLFAVFSPTRACAVQEMQTNLRKSYPAWTFDRNEEGTRWQSFSLQNLALETWPPHAIPRLMATVLVMLPESSHHKIVAAASSAEVAGLLDELAGWDSHIHGVPNPDYLACVHELVELHDCWLMPRSLFLVRFLARPGCGRAMTCLRLRPRVHACLSYA